MLQENTLTTRHIHLAIDVNQLRRAAVARLLTRLLRGLEDGLAQEALDVVHGDKRGWGGGDEDDGRAVDAGFGFCGMSVKGRATFGGDLPKPTAGAGTAAPVLLESLSFLSFSA